MQRHARSSLIDTLPPTANPRCMCVRARPHCRHAVHVHSTLSFRRPHPQRDTLVPTSLAKQLAARFTSAYVHQSLTNTSKLAPQSNHTPCKPPAHFAYHGAESATRLPNGADFTQLTPARHAFGHVHPSVRFRYLLYASTSVPAWFPYREAHGYNATSKWAQFNQLSQHLRHTACCTTYANMTWANVSPSDNFRLECRTQQTFVQMTTHIALHEVPCATACNAHAQHCRGIRT